MGMDADLGASQPGEVFLSHVSASAIEAVCLLMVDSLDLETLMKVVQDAAASACKSSLRDAGANEWCNLAFRIENSQDGVASTFPNYNDNLALAALVPGKRRSWGYSFGLARFT